MQRDNAAVGLIHHQLNPPQSLQSAGCPEESGKVVEQVFHQPPTHSQVHFPALGISHIDQSATKIYRKCHQFCSKAGHSPGSLSDYFPLPWMDKLLYTFPPIQLLPRMFLKIRQDYARVIFRAPAWPCHHWFSTLLSLLVKVPLTLLLDPDLISQ